MYNRNGYPSWTLDRKKKKLRFTSVAVFSVFFIEDLSEFIYSQIIYIFFFMTDRYKMKKTQAAFRSGTGQMELYNILKKSYYQTVR